MITILILGLLLSPLPSEVTEGQVAGIHRALQGRPLPRGVAREIAVALNRYEDPHQLLAMAIWESDLDPNALRESPGRVYDGGLLGVRCRLGGKVAEDLGSLSATSDPQYRHQRGRHKVKALGSAGALGRCTNVPVRGVSLRTLLTPRVNIHYAIKIIQRKKQRWPATWMAAYNGSSRPGLPNGYRKKVDCIRAALLGVPYDAPTLRARQLARKIERARGN